jgi:peptidoglycan/LPS O-acetylase OafA/YrhL
MASLWVLLGHITLLIDCHIKLISSPRIAVDLFILLSGYLMAKNYMERKKKEPWDSLTTMKSFWLRRFFRIAPLYYFLLGIALISGPWLGGIREFIAQYYPTSATSATAASRYADHSIFNIFTHVSFFFGFLPSYSYNTALPDWSIGLEMQFYLLFPFVMLTVLCLGYIRALLILMLLCCISRFLLGGYFVSFIIPSMILIKLNMFISGMCLAEAIRRHLPSYVALALLSSVVSIITMLNIIRLQIIMDLLMISSMAILLW